MANQPKTKFIIFGRSLLSQVVGLTGLEPVTLRLSSACSNQLSYRPWCRADDSAIRKVNNLPAAGVETRGFEPLTYSLQSYRSTS